MINNIIKRNGTKEPFTASKLNGWGEWAAKSLADRVDWSSLVMRSVASLPEECSSQDLQHTLIRQCLNMNSWPYNRMAGRLYAAMLHKDLYEKNKIPSVEQIHSKLLEAGHMVKLDYTKEEYEQVEKWINHRRDFTYAHFQLYQIRYKYALRDRVSGAELESPQFVFMRMAMALAETQPPERRMNDLFEFYEHLSKNIINAPTPNYVNLGSPLNGYASCCLYAVNDSIASLAVGDHIAYTMTASASGIGNTLHTRSAGDKVRGGLIIHQGKLPYYRAMVSAVRANIQNGRNGACTTFYTAFDPEIESLVVLKNQRTPIDKQIRGMDYAHMSNKFLARKVARKEDIFLFNTYTAPDLYKAFFSADEETFTRLYNEYENNPNFKKTYISARKVILGPLNEAFETGRAYLAFMDEINRHTSFKDPIQSSNLCVSPETLLLTDRGNKAICSLAGQKVTIWNGEEWSEVKVVKTGERQPLIKIELSNGLSLECTPYHKWYVQEDLGVREVLAEQLMPNDRLISFKPPLIEGTEVLERAYLNGFFTADGIELYGGDQRVVLYGYKRDLKDKFGEVLHWTNDDMSQRSIAFTSGLKPMHFVPSAKYTVASRLQWLAGLFDSAGCIYRKGNSAESLSLLSTRQEYLIDIQLMLQTLGISSQVVYSYTASQRLAPEGGARGEFDIFCAHKTWRLAVLADETQRLYDMGLKTQRLQVERRGYQESLDPAVMVVRVINTARKDDTYCVTEPKRHMAVFNGILTGQCMETVLATDPYESMMDLYSAESVGKIVFKANDGNIHYRKAPEEVHLTLGRRDAAQNLKVGDEFWQDEGNDFERQLTVTEIIDVKREPEVALCSLGALVISNIHTPEQYEKAMYYTLLMIDKCIHKSSYELPHVGYTAKNRLSAAVGMMDLAHHMARKKLKYSSFEGKKEIHRLAESHMYFAIKASLRLAKELGNAPWIHRTKWTDGWLPIDTYAKNVDKIVPNDLEHDWEALRAEVVAQGGIRHSTLVAYMPGESSSKASGTCNGPYPIRDVSIMKTDNDITTYWCAPDGDLLDEHYERCWDIPSSDMIECYGIIQKFTDQSISADLYRKIVGSEKVTTDEMIVDYLKMISVGMKTRYYQNTMTAKPVVLTSADVKPPADKIPYIGSGVSALIPPEQLTSSLVSSGDPKTFTPSSIYNREDDDSGCASGACSL